MFESELCNNMSTSEFLKFINQHKTIINVDKLSSMELLKLNITHKINYSEIKELE